MNETQSAINDECEYLADFLIEKNRKYGNSALEPVRIFSKADALEQMRVRMDDKLSRIRSSQDDDTEDAELDLIGYLILKRVYSRIKKREPKLIGHSPSASPEQLSLLNLLGEIHKDLGCDDLILLFDAPKI